jgi:hypothetical protein
MVQTVLNVAALQAFSSPSTTDIYYLMESGKQGFFNYVSGTYTENIGTIINSTTSTGSFFRIYPYNTVYASWFGAVGDGVTDCYSAIQAAINAVNGDGVVMLGTGVFYLGYVTTGYETPPLLLPANATGLVIRGDGEGATTIQLSANVPSLFGCDGAASTTSTVLYQNITIEKLTVDANNVGGTSVGAAQTVSSAVTGTGSYVTVTVADNTSYITGGYVFFPTTNTGTSQGNIRRFQLPSGSTTTLNVLLNSGETIAAGDTIEGACTAHVLIGTANEPANTNINYNNITFQDIVVINVPTTPVASINVQQATKRYDVDMAGAPYPGYTGSLYITGISFKRVSMYGGQLGFGIYGTSYANSNTVPVFIDNILFEDCYHSTLYTPVNQSNSYNFFVGYRAFGGTVVFNRCQGELSGDVGIETDAMTNAIYNDCVIKNSWGSGYHSTNYNAPCDAIAGSPSTTIGTSMTSSSQTTVILSSIPSGVATTGFIALNDTELCYYQLAYGSTTVTIVRGLNQTTPTVHLAGETVVFVEIDKQMHSYENCTYENTLIGLGAGAGWFQYNSEGTVFPNPNLRLHNCIYKRTSPDGALIGTEALDLVGYTGSVEVIGMKIAIDGINNTTTGTSFSTSIFSFQNLGYDSLNGASSIVPAQVVKLKEIQAIASGTLDTGASNKFQGLLLAQGNFLLDVDDFILNFNFLNAATTNTQVFGFQLGYSSTTNFVSGVINKFKFINTGNGAPIGVFTQAVTTVGRLLIDNLDFSQMYNQASSNDANYLPYRLNANNVNNIYIGTIRHYTGLTEPMAPKVVHRMAVSAAYTARYDDEFIECNTTTAAFTVTLPAINSGNTFVYPNYGAKLGLCDVGGDAATNNITISAATGEKIDGSTTPVTIANNYGALTLQATPSGWIILAKN